MKLNIELVPQTTWCVNLRSLLRKKDWDFLRRRQYQLAGHVCEICGDTSRNQGCSYDLECHEQWHYDDETHRQVLVGLVGLCKHCHEVIHFGQTELRGRGQQAIQHLLKVNHCSYEDALDLIKDAQRKWIERSSHLWEVDVSWLEKDKISLKSGFSGLES